MTDRHARARAIEATWLALARPLAVAGSSLVALVGIVSHVSIPFAVLRGALAWSALSVIALLTCRVLRALATERAQGPRPAAAREIRR
jgi:hypothetical protein